MELLQAYNPPADHLEKLNPEYFDENGKPSERLVEIGSQVVNAVNEILPGIEIKDLIVHGSQALGTNTNDDIDLMVVVDRKPQGQSANFKLFKVLNPDFAHITNFSQLQNIEGTSGIIDAIIKEPHRINPHLLSEHYSLKDKEWRITLPNLELDNIIDPVSEDLQAALARELHLRRLLLNPKTTEPRESQDRIKKLYVELMNRNQSYSVDYKALNPSSGKIVDTEWGSIFTMQGHTNRVDENPPHTCLSVYYSKNGDIIGYGGLTSDSENTSHITFKIFPEFRNIVKSDDVLKDHITTSLMTSDASIPDLLRIPAAQQYNAEVEQEVTPAPVFYRRLGFKSDNKYPNLEAKVKRRDHLDPEELKLLAKDDLIFNLETVGIKQDFSKVGSNI